MKKHRFFVVVLILGLATSLHAGFQTLSTALPSIFPNLAKERQKVKDKTQLELAQWQLREKEAEEKIMASQGSQAVAFKRSGEDSQENLLPTIPFPLPTFSEADAATLKDKSGAKRMTPLFEASGLPDLKVAKVSQSFVITPALEPLVDFWRHVYGVYSSKEVMFHDMDYLQIRYSVLNLKDIQDKDIPDSDKKILKQDAIQEETNRIKGLLTELDQAPNLMDVSPEAKKLSRLFDFLPQRSKYREALARIRTQTGLKDRFEEAVKRSGRYLAWFEAIFETRGVPREISRLAFVESLFREKAYSKVGAAGLWQFMPDTGRRYMKVGDLIDERYDPLVAADGAAQLLMKNYELLGTWPLAINAYNSGGGNLLKAVNKLGTNDIGTIVTQFKQGSYAFASRNFYPCFLAALTVYENHEKYFGKIKKEPLWEFDRVRLPEAMTLPQVAYLVDRSLDDVHEYNPAFTPPVVDGQFHVPAGSIVRIPKGEEKSFLARYGQLLANPEPSFYQLVQEGQDLKEIASNNNLPLSVLKDANRGKDLKGGSVVRIPRITNLVKE